MLQRYTAVGFISSPGIGLCSSCSLYYCSQTFFEAWPVESRTKSAGAKVLRVIRFWSTRGLKNDPFFWIPLLFASASCRKAANLCAVTRFEKVPTCYLVLATGDGLRGSIGRLQSANRDVGQQGWIWTTTTHRVAAGLRCSPQHKSRIKS